MHSALLIVQLVTILFPAKVAKLVHIWTPIIYVKLVIATVPSAQAPVLIAVHALLGTMSLLPINASIVQYSDVRLVTQPPTIASPAK